MTDKIELRIETNDGYELIVADFPEGRQVQLMAQGNGGNLKSGQAGVLLGVGEMLRMEKCELRDAFFNDRHLTKAFIHQEDYKELAGKISAQC
jgi:hypothetical protein